MCTRGSRGLAPGEPWPAPKERPSASERRAVGVGLRLVYKLLNRRNEYNDANSDQNVAKKKEVYPV